MSVAVRSLCRTYGEKVAVDDVSFEVGEDEFFVLVGPSGSGKTTTLRLVAGLTEATSGEVWLDDRLVTDHRPRDRDLAMVFQDYAIFPHLNVYENIAYGLRSRHARRSMIRAAVPEAAELFRIEHLLKRKPRQLSGGERQRVALARALVRDSQMYLYDEPLSNLDAQLRHKAREDILLLHQRKRRPSIYVTHDQSEALAMGDRIAVMRDGRIQQVGTGREIYSRPVNRFVAFFLGTPSMNFFPATVRADQDHQLTVSGDGFNLAMPASATVPASHVGREVILGIRPEDLYPRRRAPFEVNADSTLTATVEMIEPTTTGSTVYLQTVGDAPVDIVASFGARLPTSHVGQDVPLAVDTRRLHLFDADTEQALTGGDHG